MKQETKEQIEREEHFSLLENSEIVDDIPKNMLFRSPEKTKEVFDFFDKIPPNKAMKVRFADELTWKTYNQRLRYYAGHYEHGKLLSIHSRRNKEGYFIYVKKKVEGV